MNRLAGKRHLGFYELLQLLIDEQGSTETLIQQVTSGRVTASDLQIKNKKYEELQQRITALTAEYDGEARVRAATNEILLQKSRRSHWGSRFYPPFPQIGLNEQDRDVCRFLWRSRDVREAPRIYRFKRLCFGLSSSPFLAVYIIGHHVKKYQHQFPEVSNEVLENMYVDDLLFLVDEEESACEMVAQLRKLMKLGGFLLAKWASNQNAVLAGVPSGSVTEESSNPMLKALGIKWNAERDELSYPIPSNVDPNTLDTKRQLISITAKMYDPLGYLSPYLITAKILFQRLWQQGVDWNEKLPDNVHQEWKKWKMELMDIPEI
ncbi:hypothetical protein T01_2789 [Trichinella spiralis]|uniref:Reverse transcriptase domain-containing protein n=1 Tax=Trichinella spiralis TaxID=6334 RepID=A0A0V1BV48_TRISP|nr:hypothetical protein T01_2789 [Trichinella spiralis]